MGLTKWACPSCGQPMQLEHANGEQIILSECPTCLQYGPREKRARRRDADPNDDDGA